MELNFSCIDKKKIDPIYIEQVFAEKPGGGLVENPSFDVPPTTAVGEKDGKFAPIKAYKLVKAVETTDTVIEIAKGSGVTVGDVIAHGAKAVKCTAVNTDDKDKDTVTVTMGVTIPVGAILYQAKKESADNAEPIYSPLFVTGGTVKANEGDQSVRLINGANLRKETANVASEVATLIQGIKLV